MLSDEEITSDFGESQEEWKFGLKGFSQVVRLESSGSTCETFTGRRQNKMVFIKRLKPELRSAPLQRAAFAKEYELGINLIHPSLPVYRDFKDDYIVIDYVDGTTLADMIAKRDQWLMEPDNIRKMLRQLVEVVGYLHDKNVIHSDIKVDNVMITHGTHNTMLIDLDKAYTYAHNNTGGAPTNYGLEAEDKGNPAIDYNGIERIITRLTKAGFPTEQFSRFQRLCKSPDVTTGKLLNALEPRRAYKFVFPMLALLFVAGIIGYNLLSRHNNTEINNTEDYRESSGMPDSVVTLPESGNETRPEIERSQIVKPDDYEAIINREMKGNFKAVDEKIKEAETLLTSGTATDKELRDANYAITAATSIALQSAYKMYAARFPEVSAGKVELAVATCEPTNLLMQRCSQISERILLEIMHRHDETYNTPEDSIKILELEHKYPSPQQ